MVMARRPALLILCAAILACAPFAHANTQSAALEASIRAALLQDPHAASISSSDFEALVVALAVQMGRQNVAPEHIATTTPEGFQLSQTDSLDSCGGLPAPLCSWAQAHNIRPATLLWTFSLFGALAALAILLWLWKWFAPSHETV